jgi:methionyl-tRNA formyltransferase
VDDLLFNECPIPSSKKLKYLLFIGHRYGYLLLNHIKNKCLDISCVFIENDADYEIEKYSDKIKSTCKNNNLTFTDDLSIKNQNKILEQYNIDFIIVYGYRRILKKEVYDKAHHGAVAIHYALLPKYRGFAPLNWALINGEQETGVTLFFLSDDVDDGDIIEQKAVSITIGDDINSLLEKCSKVALEMLDRQINLFEQGIINRIPQDNSKASYTCSRSPEDGLIHWEHTTISIYNLIRAITYPFPCAFTHLNGEKIYILNAEICENRNYVGRIPGKIVSRLSGRGVVVLTGDGALLIKTIIDSHGNRITADEMIKSVRIKLE